MGKQRNRGYNNRNRYDNDGRLIIKDDSTEMTRSNDDNKEKKRPFKRPVINNHTR